MIAQARIPIPEIDFSTFPESDGEPVAESEIIFEVRLAALLAQMAGRDEEHDDGSEHAT